MNRTDNSTVIPWKSLYEGQKIKASPDIKSDIWWVRLNDGRYGLRINFKGIVHIDISQIRFNGADANLSEKTVNLFLLCLYGRMPTLKFLIASAKIWYLFLYMTMNKNMLMRCL